MHNKIIKLSITIIIYDCITTVIKLNRILIKYHINIFYNGIYNTNKTWYIIINFNDIHLIFFKIILLTKYHI